VAVGVALTLTLTAGGMAWKTYLPDYFPGGLTNSIEVADSASENSANSEAGADPAGATTDVSPTADSVVDDLFETEEVPQVRLASAEGPARRPNPRVVIPSDENEEPTSDEFDSLAAGDDLQEEPGMSAQSEPDDETDLVEEAVPPRGLSRDTPTFDTVEETDLDHDSSPPLAIRRGPSFAPPGESPDADEALDTPDEAAAEEPPALRFGRDAAEPEEPEAPAVELAVPQRGRGEPAPATLTGAQSEVLDPEDELEGYVEVAPTERRALSKTQVRRPTEAELAEQARDLQEVDPTVKIMPGRKAPAGDERVAITPRGRQTQSAVARTEVAAPSPGRVAAAGRPGLVQSPTSYKVEPQDTYWSISKKVYGTPRFFQALAEHNREKVAHSEQLRPGVELETPPPDELQRLYAKYIPSAGRNPEATEVADGEPSAAARYGIATGSPTRRVGGRGVEAPGGATTAPDASEFHGPDGGFFVGRGGEPLYRVANGDTLSSIAQQHLGKSSRSHELYELNQDRLADPNRLKVGSVLKLPQDASRVGVVPRGNRVR
jgi:nucleoid-associated protein YgaU